MSDQKQLKRRKVESSPPPHPHPQASTSTTPTNILKDAPPDLIITLDDIADSQKKPNLDLSMKANKYIKHILSQWESSSSSFPKELLLETKKALFPMLVLLRKTTLTADALTSLLTILYHLQRGEYMKSNESYMKLSIGNVAWPIGVASVSIHSRTAQSRLDGGKKAMIMLDETTRRWITAVKRLITFKEKFGEGEAQIIDEVEEKDEEKEEKDDDSII